jgi:hypothetical protein
MKGREGKVSQKGLFSLRHFRVSADGTTLVLLAKKLSLSLFPSPTALIESHFHAKVQTHFGPHASTAQ